MSLFFMILLQLHSIWSINSCRYAVYLLMGHTAKFALEWSNFSGIMLEECLGCHKYWSLESVNGINNYKVTKIFPRVQVNMNGHW